MERAISSLASTRPEMADRRVQMAVSVREGHFRIHSQIDGPDLGPLGELWRPKFFDGGFAFHGDSYVPPEPVSHGCVRVSDEAIDWIWSANLAPIGTAMWIY